MSRICESCGKHEYPLWKRPGGLALCRSCEKKRFNGEMATRVMGNE